MHRCSPKLYIAKNVTSLLLYILLSHPTTFGQFMTLDKRTHIFIVNIRFLIKCLLNDHVKSFYRSIKEPTGFLTRHLALHACLNWHSKVNACRQTNIKDWFHQTGHWYFLKRYPWGYLLYRFILAMRIQVKGSQVQWTSIGKWVSIKEGTCYETQYSLPCFYQLHAATWKDLFAVNMM